MDSFEEEKIRLVLGAYKKLYQEHYKKFNLTIHLNMVEIRNRVETDFVMGCYDILYGMSPEDIDSAEIIRILNNNKLFYVYKGEYINSPVVPLFLAESINSTIIVKENRNDN